MKRYVPNALYALTFAAILFSSSHAWGLINVKFTPVQLVQRASAIVLLDVGPLSPRKELPVRFVKTTHGKFAADSVAIDVRKASQNRLTELREVLRDGRRPALLFAGVLGRPGARNALGSQAALHVGHRWFTLTSVGPGQWTLDEKDEVESRMQAVWAGGTEMLQRAVEYVQSDPQATVPATAGVRWATRKHVATVAGPVAAAAAIDLEGKGPLALFIASEAGDRLLEGDSAGDKMQDVTARMKLQSKSRVAAWGHFSGTLRLDLASSDGKTVTLWRQSERGVFEAQPRPIVLPRGCIGLAAIDAHVAARARLLVSSSAAPVVLVPSTDGSFQAVELPSPGKEGDLVRSLPCVAADFDGDGIVDVLQPRAVSSVFYRGKSPGTFDPPAVLKSLGTGPDGRIALVGDWDGDGQLDLFVVGENGCFAWRNLGKGRFEDVYEETGELAYKAARNAVGGTACDVNNDGRQDLVVAYADQAPHVFFNRGFFTFGFAAQLKLEDDRAIPDLDEGVQAAVAADFTQSGVESLTLVLKSGAVWRLSPAAEKPLGSKSPAGHAASVRLATGALGPTTVVGYDGPRCLGARLVAPGLPAWFGKPGQGPLKLLWHDSAGREQTKLIEVSGSTKVTLSLTKAPQP